VGIAGESSDIRTFLIGCVLLALTSCCATRGEHYLPDVEERRFPTIEAAVFYGLAYAEGVSLTREVGGYVSRHPRGGYVVVLAKAKSGAVKVGARNEIRFRMPANASAFFHTHPVDKTRPDYWQCSPEDVQASVQSRIPGFVKAPGKQIQNCLLTMVEDYRTGWSAISKVRGSAR